MEDIDPLTQAHLDLAAGKTPTHFDQVLQLKGKAKDAFRVAAEKFYYRKFQNTQTAYATPKLN